METNRTKKCLSDQIIFGSGNRVMSWKINTRAESMPMAVSRLHRKSMCFLTLLHCCPHSTLNKDAPKSPFKLMSLKYLFLSFSTGSRQKRGSSPFSGYSVAAVVQRPEYAHQGSVLGTPEDDVTLREADSQRHRPHLSWTWILQGERQFGPGSTLQCHEGKSAFVFEEPDCMQINW